MALTGCRGERATVTGQYGADVVSGEVIMADGGSPAGVQVSVGGTGMRTVVGADGMFAFAGAPEDAELVFERTGDGLFAKLRVGQNPGAMIIELAKSEAKKGSGKRRGARTGGPATQFEGVIRSATATQIVVFTSKGVEQAIALAPETIIRKGNTPVPPAELLVDTRVHVKARRTETGYSAILIIVQKTNGGGDDDGEANKVKLSGVVTAVSATGLTVQTGTGSVSVTTDASTRIEKKKSAISLTDIQAGDRVKVEGTRTGENVVLAREIEVK